MSKKEKYLVFEKKWLFKQIDIYTYIIIIIGYIVGLITGLLMS